MNTRTNTVVRSSDLTSLLLITNCYALLNYNNMKDLKEIEELKRYVAKKAIEWAEIENTCSKEHHDLYKKISFLMDVIITVKNINK